MEPDEEIRRGNEAERLLREPLLLEAFEKIEQACLAEWKNAPTRDTEGRERIWTMVKLLERVKAHLTAVAQTGRLASAKVAEDDRKRKFNIFSR